MNELIKRLQAILNKMPDSPELRGAFDITLSMEERVETISYNMDKRDRFLLDKA